MLSSLSWEYTVMEDTLTSGLLPVTHKCPRVHIYGNQYSLRHTWGNYWHHSISGSHAGLKESPPFSSHPAVFFTEGAGIICYRSSIAICNLISNQCVQLVHKIPRIVSRSLQLWPGALFIPRFRKHNETCQHPSNINQFANLSFCTHRCKCHVGMAVVLSLYLPDP